MTSQNMHKSYPQRVALIFGGMSSEHEISIFSASKVVTGLAALPNGAALHLQLIYITREGRWIWAAPARDGRLPGEANVLAAGQWLERAAESGARALSFGESLVRLKEDAIDVALLILHGQNGEDGRLQGALDLAGIPYTGSGAGASALAFDKPRCQAVLNAAGLPIATSISIRTAADGGLDGAERILKLVGLPCVIKPARGGSSVGITIVREAAALAPALERALQVDEELMAERFVEGREFTCGLLEKEGELIALPVTEIIPPDGRFFDYEAKYKAGLSREVTPAEIPNALAVKIQTLARAVHQAVGCRGFSRVDFIADPAEPVILEINTIPGMTATSLLPQAAAARGIAFPELLGLMLASARHD